MGYITNQWVNRGGHVKSRPYNPVPVPVSCLVPTDSWAKEHGALCELESRKENGEFQTVLLEQAEIDEAAKVLFSRMTAASRDSLVAEFLQGLSDRKLLRLLAADLRNRVKVP